MMKQIPFLFILMTLLACAGTGAALKKTVKYPNEVTPQMRAQFAAAEEKYRQKETDEADKLYQAYIDSFGYNALTDEAYYKRGKLRFLQKDYAGAIQFFNTLIQKTPHPNYHAKGGYLAAYAHYKKEDYENALSVLKEVEEGLLPPKLRLRHYSLIIYSSQFLDKESDLAQYAQFKLYDLYEQYGREFQDFYAADLLSYAQLQTLLEAWVLSPVSEKNIASWMKTYDGGAAKSLIEYKIAKIAFEAGEQKKARRLLTLFVQKYPKSPYYDTANKLLADLGGPEEIQVAKQVRFKIGVLAPMSGKYARYGESVLKGVRCAAGAGVCGGESGIEVVMKDSGLTKETVELALDELKRENVSGIVGLLPGDLADAAGLVASQRKIPLFLVSQQDHVMDHGDYVFQMGLPPEDQILELVKRARSKGYRNFAIFYPNIRYGETMVGLFTKHVLDQGGKIVAKASYNHDTKDPFADARRFKVDMKLSGEGRFDAIFLPDTYHAVNVMATALAFNEIKDVPLLGTNTWNHDSLSDTIKTSFPGSFFIDLYDPQSNSLENQDFKQKFQQSFGEAPQVLQALSYDGAMMIHKAVSQGGANQVYKIVSQGQSFKGVTGLRGFQAGVGPVVTPKVIAVQ